jgi:hypothetical protein
MDRVHHPVHRPVEQSDERWWMMIGTNSLVGAQALTFAIPIGTFAVVCLWFFFQRRPNR